MTTPESEPRAQFAYTPVNQHEMVYRNMLRDALAGEPVDSRGEPSTAIFGVMATFDLRQGFPLLTGRKLYPRGMLGELKAFLEGATWEQDFRKHGCNYWKPWAGEDGYLGQIYGAQWRNWGYAGVDQLYSVIEEAKRNPGSRRLVVSAWNPGVMNSMALPPCHYAFQLNCTQSGELDLLFHMRSLDLMVGLPSDLVVYGTLLRILAKQLKRSARFLKITVGSSHVYDNQRELALEYLDRPTFPPPRQIFYQDDLTIDNFNPADVVWENYHHGEPMDIPVMV
jgi:thymidylate synthase